MTRDMNSVGTGTFSSGKGVNRRGQLFYCTMYSSLETGVLYNAPTGFIEYQIFRWSVLRSEQGNLCSTYL